MGKGGTLARERPTRYVNGDTRYTITNGVPIIAASTVAVPLAMMPAREGAGAGKAPLTKRMEWRPHTRASTKLRSNVGATGSRKSYPEPSFETDSRIAGKF